MKNLYQPKYYLFSVLVLVATLGACKKDKPAPKPEEPADVNTKQTPTTNRVELSNDSIFLYAKTMYYWNTSLPTYDAYMPRQYNTGGSNESNYETNLYNIGKASNSVDYTGGSNGFLKYSYLDDITQHNPQASVRDAQASVDLEGNGNDIGIRTVAYLAPQPAVNYALYITAVYPGSPADNAGIKRGFLIKKINGVSFGTNYNSEVSTLNSFLSGSSVNLEGVQYTSGVAGPTVTISLSKTSYRSSPVYAAKTITAGTKKIGYLAFARFSDLNGNAKTALDAAFSGFSANGVTDVIVDLRYNGGGYINTAEYLINLLAPSSLNGRLMYREYYNSRMQNGQVSILANQPLPDENGKLQYKNGRLVTYADVNYKPENNSANFQKAGNLNSVSNIIFIVSGNTASASELVINSLKPGVNVKLVGRTTYGKPVGFFPVRIENRYDVYYALFETKNSNNEGGYFNGMTPDYAENTSIEPTFFDNPRYDFGDPNEGYLAKAISVVPGAGLPVSGFAKGSSMSAPEREFSASSQHMENVKPASEFNGMVKTRFTMK